MDMNDPEDYKSKVCMSYMYVDSVPESKVSARFALRPAVFELETILRKVYPK